MVKYWNRNSTCVFFVWHVGYGRLRSATAGHGRPRPATAGHGRPRPATVGHGRPRSATVGHGRPRPATVGYGRLRPATVGCGRLRSATVGYGWLRPAKRSATVERSPSRRGRGMEEDRLQAPPASPLPPTQTPAGKPHPHRYTAQTGEPTTHSANGWTYNIQRKRVNLQHTAQTGEPTTHGTNGWTYNIRHKRVNLQHTAQTGEPTTHGTNGCTYNTRHTHAIFYNANASLRFILLLFQLAILQK